MSWGKTVAVLCSVGLAAALLAARAGDTALTRWRDGSQSATTTPAFEESVASLIQAQRSGRTTARAIAERYLARIRALDRQGPALRAVIELNPDALSIADMLDAERRRSGLRGPLHGVPVLIKDNIDTADRMATTAGSLALQGHIARQDAFIVERLRAAGAVLLGKTNLSEWANFRSTRSTSGWSARGGLVRNPYALDRNACGSSSGTAVAVAADFATVGVGTETDGSILCPSAAVSLVGIKPTVGLVSRRGIIPIAHSQDTAGPMTRTVADAALLLQVLAAPDSSDRTVLARPADLSIAYGRALDGSALRGARIGVARARFFGYQAAVDRLAEQAIDRLRAAGAVIVDPADIPHADEYRRTELEVLLYEFKHGLNAYLASLGPGAPVRSLTDLIAFNEANRSTEMPHFGQELLVEAQQRGDLDDPAYKEALATNERLARREGLDAVLDGLKLDALVAPTGPPPWKTDLANGDAIVGSSTSPAAVAGYPSITVPVGYIDGLPVGLSFIGRAWQESKLIALAYAFEQVTRHRRPPTFPPSVDEPVR